MTALLTAASRAATDELLARLRAGRWRPAAWARFMSSSMHRSAHQARSRPRALVELTAVHAVLALMADRRGRRCVAVSWALTATHLGMLEQQRSLGIPNAITLLRANLPALGQPAPWMPVVAVATDLLDGRLARHQGRETAFGQYADSLTDAVFWTWFTMRHEPSRAIQLAALATWTIPPMLVTMASISDGRMVDPPRPVMLRPAAAMQVLVAGRALRRSGQ